MRVQLGLILCLSLVIPSGAEAADRPRRHLDLSALSAKTQEALLKQIPALKGEDFHQSDLDSLIRYLVNQEQFDLVQVQVEEKANDQVFFLNLGKTKRISQLNFSGISSFSEGDLRHEFLVAEKSVFDTQALMEAGERIRRFYRDQGYLNTIVDLEFVKRSASDMEVNVKVKEGLLTKITDVELKASNPEFQQRYLSFLKKKLLKEPYTEQSIANMRKNLREEFSGHSYYQADLTGPEVDMNTDESQAKLIFTVANSDEIFVQFEGTRLESQSAIKNFIELDTFYSANPDMAPELSTRVRNFYLARGYARAEVTGQEKEGAKAHTKVVDLKVSEGPKVKIKEIKFSGKFSRPEKDYVNFLKDHSADVVSDGYYNRDAVEIGIKNLLIDRQNQGYLKAKILSTKTTYQGEKRDEVQLFINIDEGPLTILENVKFEGNTSFSEGDLLKVVGLQPQAPLKLNELEGALTKIKEFYRNSGFLEMRLLNESNEKEDLVQYNADASQARVKMVVAEGPKVVVAGILIEGNSLTRDYVILKELDFKLGDTLTPQLIDESINRLQRLGHFSSVEIKTLEEKTQIASRTVVVRVVDRNPGLFNLGVGANNERELTLRGYTGIAYRNILGTGRGVSARFEESYNPTSVKFPESKITIGYLEPYLFDTRMKLRLNYTGSTTVTDFDTRKATDLKQITWSVEQDITSHILLSYDLWSSAQYRTFPIDPGNPNKIPRDEQVIVTTGPNLDIDFRDHPFNPSKGTFTRLSAEYSSPTMGSSSFINYWKAIGTFSHYLGLGKAGWVFANSARGGVLQNLSREGGVPYDKKGLLLGGQSTIRGFQPGEAFPNEFDLGVPPDQYFAKNRTTMYLIKSEVRFPIYGSFGGALFYDGGAVFLQDNSLPANSSIKQDPYRDAVGVAFRYATPVGAVSFEWAYKLDRRSERNESQWPFYFSIGTF